MFVAYLHLLWLVGLWIPTLAAECGWIVKPREEEVDNVSLTLFRDSFVVPILVVSHLVLHILHRIDIMHLFVVDLHFIGILCLYKSFWALYCFFFVVTLRLFDAFVVISYLSPAVVRLCVVLLHLIEILRLLVVLCIPLKLLCSSLWSLHVFLFSFWSAYRHLAPLWSCFTSLCSHFSSLCFPFLSACSHFASHFISVCRLFWSLCQRFAPLCSHFVFLCGRFPSVSCFFSGAFLKFLDHFVDHFVVLPCLFVVVLHQWHYVGEVKGTYRHPTYVPDRPEKSSIRAAERGSKDLDVLHWVSQI